jgi:hypothetical protein
MARDDGLFCIKIHKMAGSVHLNYLCIVVIDILRKLETSF